MIGLFSPDFAQDALYLLYLLLAGGLGQVIYNRLELFYDILVIAPHFSAFAQGLGELHGFDCVEIFELQLMKKVLRELVLRMNKLLMGAVFRFDICHELYEGGENRFIIFFA